MVYTADPFKETFGTQVRRNVTPQPELDPGKRAAVRPAVTTTPTQTPSWLQKYGSQLVGLGRRVGQSGVNVGQNPTLNLLANLGAGSAQAKETGAPLAPTTSGQAVQQPGLQDQIMMNILAALGGAETPGFKAARDQARVDADMAREAAQRRLGAGGSGTSPSILANYYGGIENQYAGAVEQARQQSYMDAIKQAVAYQNALEEQALGQQTLKQRGLEAYNQGELERWKAGTDAALRQEQLRQQAEQGERGQTSDYWGMGMDALGLLSTLSGNPAGGAASKVLYKLGENLLGKKKGK